MADWRLVTQQDPIFIGIAKARDKIWSQPLKQGVDTSLTRKKIMRY